MKLCSGRCPSPFAVLVHVPHSGVCPIIRGISANQGCPDPRLCAYPSKSSTFSHLSSRSRDALPPASMAQQQGERSTDCSERASCSAVDKGRIDIEQHLLETAANPWAAAASAHASPMRTFLVASSVALATTMVAVLRPSHAAAASPGIRTGVPTISAAVPAPFLRKMGNAHTNYSPAAEAPAGEPRRALGSLPLDLSLLHYPPLFATASTAHHSVHRLSTAAGIAAHQPRPRDPALELNRISYQILKVEDPVLGY